MSLVTRITDGNSAKLNRRIRRMEAFQRRGLHILARFTAFRIQRVYGVYISRKARLASDVVFPHPTGIVIGDGVVVHDRVTIFQNVTLGGARVGDQKRGHYPEIGAGTVIFAGAVIVGAVRIGVGCVIGANSVVLHDVPDNSVAVGAPARIVERRSSTLAASTLIPEYTS